MFWITDDPSSGSLVQCLAKNNKNDSIVSFDMDKVSVMATYSDPLCVCVVHCIWRHLIIIDARCKHEDLFSLPWAFEWLNFVISVFQRDRIRTTNNMLGDCYAAAIVEHLSKEQLVAAGAAVHQVRTKLNLYTVN